MQFLEMKVGGIALDQTITQPFFVLKDAETKHSFPVPISDKTSSVSTPNGTFLQGENPYASLLSALIDQGKMHVDQIAIMENEQSKLEGIVTISGINSEDLQLVTTPGEAVVMAVLYALPIYLEDSLLTKSEYFRSKTTLSRPEKVLESLIPKSIVEMQGGELSLKSKKDKVQ